MRAVQFIYGLCYSTEHNDIGKRIGLTEKDDVIAWLHRKGEIGGFSVSDVSFDRVYWYDSKHGIQDKPLGAVVFDGLLRITNLEKLLQVLQNGVGTQKAFGFGLLSIAPVR